MSRMNGVAKWHQNTTHQACIIIDASNPISEEVQVMVYDEDKMTRDRNGQVFCEKYSHQVPRIQGRLSYTKIANSQIRMKILRKRESMNNIQKQE